MTPEDLCAVSQAAIDAWNARDLDRFFGFFRDDVRYHGNPGDDLHGVTALRERYSMALQICPDLTITADVVVPGADGRSLTSVQTEAGTTSDGKPFGFRGMMLLRFDDDGLVEEAWEMMAPLT